MNLSLMRICSRDERQRCEGNNIRKKFSLLVDRVLISPDKLVYFENLDSDNCFDSRLHTFSGADEVFRASRHKRGVALLSNISWQQKIVIIEASMKDWLGIDKFLMDVGVVIQSAEEEKFFPK